jgi:hypothetical protein
MPSQAVISPSYKTGQLVSSFVYWKRKCLNSFNPFDLVISEIQIKSLNIKEWQKFHNSGQEFTLHFYCMLLQ